MKIKNIQAINLFSWKKLHLDITDSITSFVGDTGSGKSSIFEILTWVLFKKCSKKTVHSYGKKAGFGIIYFDSGLVVQRNTSEPTKILCAHNCDKYSEIEQEALDSLLGCSYETFMAAIMCNQKRVASFVNEKTDSGKAKIFGDMLGIGILDKARAKIAKSKNEDQIAYETTKATWEVLNEQLEVYKMKLGNLTPIQYREGAVRLQAGIAKLKKHVELVQKKRDDAVEILAAWKMYEENERYFESIKLKNKQNKDRMGELNLKIANKDRTHTDEYLVELKDKLGKWNARYYKLEAARNINDKNIMIYRNLIELENAVCHTCGALIDKDKIAGILKKLFLTFEELKPAIQKCSAAIVRLKDMIAGCEENLRDYQKIVNELEMLKGSKDTSFEIGSKPKQEKPDLSAITIEFEAASKTLLDSRGLLRTKVEVLTGLKQASTAVKQAKTKLVEAGRVYYVTKWLFNNLPLVKLMYIDENKVVLESSINEYLSSMKLPFIVKIDTQKELKSSKEIRDEFSFSIFNIDKKADKNDISGGEEVLVLLAVQFAINDLVNPNIDLEIYDEVCGALDDHKADIIIDMLKERGARKQIFIISHKTEIASAFDTMIKIGMKEGSSYVKNN
jgi:DNA repair exonuclease SbcCD ATPase subunit